MNIDIQEFFVCVVCEKPLPFSSYYTRCNGTKRRGNKCKSCVKESRREYLKQYGQKHREQKIEYLSKYYKENKKELLEKQKNYRQANKAKIAKTNKEYYKKTQKKSNARINEYIHRQRAKKFNAQDIVRGITIDSVAQQKGTICYLCGEHIDLSLSFPNPMAGSLDHKISLSRGGSHTFENVFVVHLKCNWKKGVK